MVVNPNHPDMGVTVSDLRNQTKRCQQFWALPNLRRKVTTNLKQVGRITIRKADCVCLKKCSTGSERSISTVAGTHTDSHYYLGEPTHGLKNVRLSGTIVTV